MQKVVHIIHGMSIGGVEVAIKEYYEYQSKSVEYYLFCIDPVEDNFIDRNISLHEFNGIHKPATFMNIAKKVLEIKPDVILTSLWKGHFIGLFLKIFVYSKASYCGFLHNTKYFHIFDSVFSKLALKQFNYFFFDSQASYIFSKEVKTSNRNRNWIVPPIVKCMEESEFKEKQFTSPYRLCFMGRIVEQKNIMYAINIIQHLQQMNIPMLFDIYGEGKQLQEMNKLIFKNNNIRYCGPLKPEQVIRTMCEYDFYIQTSHVEGLAISVVQALSCGLVSFLTPVGEIANYSDDGVNAIHLTGNNFAFDANKISKYLNNTKECKLISKNAFISVSKMPRFNTTFDQALVQITTKN